MKKSRLSTTRFISGALFAGVAISLSAVPVQAASNYPERPIQVIVPFAPGGGLDMNARRFSQSLSEVLDESVVVINRAGAAGTIGMQQLARSAPDGYMLGFSPAVPLTSEPHRSSQVSYELSDFQPICHIFDNIFAVAIHENSDIQTIQELVERTRSQDTPLSYGTPGTGSIPHLGVSDIEADTGVTFNHIPYKGDGPMMHDLLAERLDFGVILASSASATIESGVLKLLAVFSADRHPFFPDVPTLKEAGIDVEQPSFGGLLASKGTPEPVIAKLEQACQVAAEDESYQQWAAQNNQVLDYQNAVSFQERLEHDSELKRVTIQRLGLSN